MSPEIITHNHALRLRAKQDLTTVNGTPYQTGEEWLVRDVGSYLLGVFEEVLLKEIFVLCLNLISTMCYMMMSSNIV